MLWSHLWLVVATVSLHRSTHSTAKLFDKASIHEIELPVDTSFIDSPATSGVFKHDDATGHTGRAASQRSMPASSSAVALSQLVYSPLGEKIDLSTLTANVGIPAFTKTNQSGEILCLDVPQSVVNLKALAHSMDRINDQDGVVGNWTRTKHDLMYGVPLAVPNITVQEVEMPRRKTARQCAFTTTHSAAAPSIVDLLVKPPADDAAAVHLVGTFVGWMRALAVLHDGHLSYLPTITDKVLRSAAVVPNTIKRISTRELSVIFDGVSKSSKAVIMPRILSPQAITDALLAQDIAVMGKVAVHISNLLQSAASARPSPDFVLCQDLLKRVTDNCRTSMRTLNQLNWLKLWLGQHKVANAPQK